MGNKQTFKEMIQIGLDNSFSFKIDRCDMDDPECLLKKFKSLDKESNLDLNLFDREIVIGHHGNDWINDELTVLVRYRPKQDESTASVINIYKPLLPY